MATEIERKYLVKRGLWRPMEPGTLYHQGYLSAGADGVVRVRIAGNKGYLTVKGRTSGLSRLEFEYEIPVSDAAEMLDRLCARPLIEKTRHRERHGGRIWEVDVFHGENEGLVLAEIELVHPEESVELPPWAGAEVSSDPRFFNNNLVARPYRTWGALVP